MKLYQKSITVETKGLNDFTKITDEIQKIVNESKIKNGIVFVNNLHNTAAVIMQEDDPTIFKDMFKLLDKILPMNDKYAHDYEGNENAVAHQKQNLLGNSVSIPIKDGKLVLGTWQDVFLVELFEPRKRETVVTILGE